MWKLLCELAIGLDPIYIEIYLLKFIDDDLLL